ncbi:carbamoyl-phosphate synthase large subunit, partial [bacterium]|nr:carbamoyl-phosphate synthase large subunit [bacterium]
PRSGEARTVEEALEIAGQVGFPCVIRPSFTLGGTGASIAYNIEEFRVESARGLEASPVSQILVEESVLGWKEFELELIRDKNDNVVVICSIENLDPMGVHTGDSITIAPAQTLSDVEYQNLRDKALAIIREVGVDTGGSNIQFAVHPQNGRVVATMGRTFKESLQKALRSLEVKWWGLNPLSERRQIKTEGGWIEGIRNYIKTPKPDRLLWVAQAFREGFSEKEIYELTCIDPWFLRQIKELTEEEIQIRKFAGRVTEVSKNQLLEWKRAGFSDKALSVWLQTTEETIRNLRNKHQVIPVYKCVDTCSAEFESFTPYFYSTYEEEGDDLSLNHQKKVMILGGGPNRIGQGIEFDYCCVQALFALQEEGFESIMVNCNPETVSTDYDMSDKLYFEPLTLEDILHIVNHEKPMGVVVHFGGQTPLNLSRELAKLNVPILGTSAQAIEVAEDRDKFRALCNRLQLRQPESVVVTDPDQVLEAAEKIGYPLLVRPSYVLGGRGMEIIYNSRELQKWSRKKNEISEDSPLLMDRFLKNAVEVDVDAICDGEDVLIVGMMEQIHEAGVHSGDSACSLPPMSLSSNMQSELERQTRLMALALNVKGLINIQFAIEDNNIFIIEVNPRASRTVPFASKARGIPFAKFAMKVMLGKKLKELDVSHARMDLVYVKESVFPFKRFPETDIVLGPEMRSTGEVMGVGKTFGEAFGKATLASGYPLPLGGTAFLSVKDSDKKACLPIAKELV